MKIDNETFNQSGDKIIKKEKTENYGYLNEEQQHLLDII